MNFYFFYIVVLLFLNTFFIESGNMNHNNKNKKYYYDKTEIDKTKYSKIEIVLNYKGTNSFYFYLPKGTYNWNSFLNKCKEFAENQQYCESYKYIKENKVFENIIFVADLYGVEFLNNHDNTKCNLKSNFSDHKLKGEFDINDDYSFGFSTGTYCLEIFRNCKLNEDYNKKYKEIRCNIKLGNYKHIMNEINKCFNNGEVIGIYCDEECKKEIRNEGDNLTKVNEDFIFLKFQDQCYSVLPYNYNLDLDDEDKGIDQYSFFSESNYDSRKKNQVTIYNFFKDLCKNQIRYDNHRYNFSVLGGHKFCDLKDFEESKSILKKVIIIKNNGKKTIIDNINAFKNTIMNRNYTYKFILYKNNNVIEIKFLTEDGKLSCLGNKIYDYHTSIPEHLKKGYKDEIDVYGTGVLPLKLKYFDFLTEKNKLIKILDNNGNELPIKNPNNTFNYYYVLPSGKYTVYAKILSEEDYNALKKKLENSKNYSNKHQNTCLCC